MLRSRWAKPMEWDGSVTEEVFNSYVATGTDSNKDAAVAVEGESANPQSSATAATSATEATVVAGTTAATAATAAASRRDSFGSSTGSFGSFSRPTSPYPGGMGASSSAMLSCGHAGPERAHGAIPSGDGGVTELLALPATPEELSGSLQCVASMLATAAAQEVAVSVRASLRGIAAYTKNLAASVPGVLELSSAAAEGPQGGCELLRQYTELVEGDQVSLHAPALHHSSTPRPCLSTFQATPLNPSSCNLNSCTAVGHIGTRARVGHDRVEASERGQKYQVDDQTASVTRQAELHPTAATAGDRSVRGGGRRRQRGALDCGGAEAIPHQSTTDA